MILVHTGPVRHLRIQPLSSLKLTRTFPDIGRVIYGSPETALLALTGDHDENPTMNQSCRETFSKGQKDIQVIGPVAETEEAVVQSHRTFWKER